MLSLSKRTLLRVVWDCMVTKDRRGCGEEGGGGGEEVKAIFSPFYSAVSWFYLNSPEIACLRRRTTGV